MTQPPRQPTDLDAATADLKARVRRVIGDLEAIEQLKEPVLQDPRRVFLVFIGPSAGKRHNSDAEGMVALMAERANKLALTLPRIRRIVEVRSLHDGANVGRIHRQPAQA